MSDEEKYVFEKLTPISDSDLGIYQNALDFVFSNDDIKNVAISGAYGAGKSSILSTYKAKNKNLKFVHISLAHFQSNLQNDLDNEVKESVIEGKILNQLIHQIPSERIPQTNFKVKSPVEHHDILRPFFIVTFLLIALLHLLFDVNWRNFIDSLDTEWLKRILHWTTSPTCVLISGLVAFVLSAICIYYVIQMQKNKKIFKKLSVQGNEIEIFSESDESYFDKYLNEVLYLFENVDANVIVFEDMDRFDANRVFERLREINTLTNLHREAHNDNPLRFFYLLRDDLFVSKDRTKFFDYIVPVVPVVDGSNSYNQFISHLKKNNLYEIFNAGFLQGLSLYVDDMRLLKNICNEFLIYYTRLNITELDPNKMLAIITYKNLFPRDFCNLQLNKGFVYALFSNKEEFIKKEISRIEQSIAEKQAEIDAYNREHLENIQELDDVYNGKRSRTPRSYPAQREYESNLDDWKKNVYPERKRAIEQRIEHMLPSLEKELGEMKHHQSIISNQTLAHIITRDNVDEIFKLTTKNEIGDIQEYNEVKCSEYFSLLKYLIRNGYIDESYADYMTYFYENSLSRTDKIFLRSVTDKKAKEADYYIRNPTMVFERLNPMDFDQEEVLNYQLLDFIVDNPSGRDCFLHFISQIQTSRNYAFLDQYYENTAKIAQLTVQINKYWPHFFAEAVVSNELGSNHVRQFSINTLYYSDPETILAINNEGVLADYIVAQPDFLAIENPDVEKLIDRFILLKIRFPEISYSVSDRKLFDAVYSSDCYELNYENIALMLHVQCGVLNDQDIIHKTSTLIFASSSSPLFCRINDEITAYIRIILENCGNQISDDEDVALDIINNTAIDVDNRKQYISFLTTTIDQIESVEDKDMWTALVSTDAISHSVKNIIKYFLYKDELVDELISFINDSIEPLDFSNLDQSYGEEKGQFFDAVIVCNDIKDDLYTQIVVSLGFSYDYFDIPDISDNKMKILIDSKIIPMCAESLEYVRNHYPQLAMYYISSFIDEYISIMSLDLFSEDELIALLSMDITDAQKINLLEWTKMPISIVNKSYSEEIKKYLLNNNMDRNDLGFLYAEYANISKDIQNIILKYAVNNIQEIIKNPGIASLSLIDSLMASPDVSGNNKISLLIAVFQSLDQAQVINYLHCVGLKDFEDIFNPQKRPKFIDTKENRNLLHAFVDHGWLFEFYEDNEYLRVRRTEPRKKE